MDRIERIMNFVVTCERLKTLTRSGWAQWNVDQERIESVAEHIYGVQMLALASYLELDYDIDLSKVMMMLAVHELEETVIGDLVYFEITKEEKERIGHEAVSKILSGLANSDQIRDLIFEFDAHETPESIFAYMCDKLECDIQCKLYDERGGFNENSIKVASRFKDPAVQELMKERSRSISNMWITNDQNKIPFDDNFNQMAEYVKTHKLTKND